MDGWQDLSSLPQQDSVPWHIRDPVPCSADFPDGQAIQSQHSPVYLILRVGIPKSKSTGR